MLKHSLLLLTSGLANLASAVFIDEAGVTDWHRYQIGIVKTLQNSDQFISLYTEQNILAVLNATTKELIWRQKLDSSDKPSEGLLADSITMNNGHLRKWNLNSGSLEWEYHTESPSVKVVDNYVYVAEGDTMKVLNKDKGNEITSVKPVTGEIILNLVEEEGEGVRIITDQRGYIVEDAEFKILEEVELGTEKQKDDDEWKKIVKFDDSTGTLTNKYNNKQLALGYTGTPLFQAGSESSFIVQHSNGVLQFVDLEKLEIVAERDESLAEPLEVLILDYPTSNESSLDDDELWYEEHSNVIFSFLRRTTRHIKDLKNLPGFFVNIFKSLAPVQSESLIVERLEKFGLRKLIIFVSKTGRVVALDSAKRGETVWALDSVEVNKDSKIWSWHNVVGIVTNGHLTLIDGAEGVVTNQQNLGCDVEKVIKVEDQGVSLWTREDELITIQGSAPSKSNFFTTKIADTFVQGYTGVESDGSKFQLEPTWKYKLPEGFKIIGQTQRKAGDKTVNIGTVQQDRTVLYKYLHPNLLVIGSVLSSVLRIDFLDTVTGRVLHSVTHSDLNPEIPTVHLAFAEHKLVYSYVSPQGTLLNSLPLYQSQESNVRLLPESYSSFDSFASPSTPHNASVILPYRVSSLTTTTTLHGITRRAVLFSTSTQLHMVDPNQVLSYDIPLLGLNGIDTQGAASGGLESSAVVVSYGIDIFGTRIAPSGEFDLMSSHAKGRSRVVYTVCIMMILARYVRSSVGKKKADRMWGAE